MYCKVMISEHHISFLYGILIAMKLEKYILLPFLVNKSSTEYNHHSGLCMIKNNGKRYSKKENLGLSNFMPKAPV